MPTLTYLQMFDRAEIRSRKSGDPQFSIREALLPQWKLNRFLYELVGEQWQWIDKLVWNEEEWREYAARVRTFVATYAGNIAGYYELLNHPDEPSMQISYFGLAPEFIGRGFGGPLLTDALERAWESNTKRVWVHTCDLDHPAAIRNYLARGMTIYKVAPE